MPTQRLVLSVRGMTCASCGLTIERVLRRQDGVLEARANSIDRRVTILYDPGRIEWASLVSAIQRLGYRVPDEEIRDV